MKKRLRKKLNKGEFTILGFKVSAEHQQKADGFLLNDLWDALDTHGLLLAGDVSSPMKLEVWQCPGCHPKAQRLPIHPFKQTSEADREFVKEWLESNGFQNVVVGKLMPLEQLDHELYEIWK